jgi:hypothetical protein
MSATSIALLYACAEIPPASPSVIPEPSTTDAAAHADPVDADMAGGDLHGKPPTSTAEDASLLADLQAPCRDPDLWLYRERTVALLRRYMRLSIEVGRMPSLLGREFFRARVTSYKASTFEDSVIFVHDVERSLEELNEFEKKLIARVVLQHYSLNEAGRVLGCGHRTVQRFLPDTLDRVSEIFLERGILAGLHRTKPVVPKSCQGGKNDEILSSE